MRSNPNRGSKPGERRGGRAKGVPNKITREFRETVRLVLDRNHDNIGQWLDTVAADDPARALDLVSKLAEYAAPKLARTEHTGKDGGPMQLSGTVTFVSSDGPPKS